MTMTTIANADLSRCIQAPTGATGNLADADVSAIPFGQPPAKRRKVVVAPPAALVAAPNLDVAMAPVKEERGSGRVPAAHGHIIVASADARAHMAATIRANRKKVAHFTEYPGCRFVVTDADGRELVWEMRRAIRKDGKSLSGWRFYVPTITGYRSDMPHVALHDEEATQYLLASEEELGSTIKMEVLTRLRKLHPDRPSVMRVPPLPVSLPPNLAFLPHQPNAPLPPLPPLTAGGAADGAADDGLPVDELWAAVAPTVAADDTWRGDALLDLYASVLNDDDDDDMLGGGTVDGVRVDNLAAELEAHPITADNLEELAGFVDIADGLDPYWPMRELEVAAGLVELPELEAAFDAMEVEVETGAATDAAAMADGFFA